MRIIIDRFEGDIAVVELGDKMLNAPRELFPKAKEGDTVEIRILGKVHRKGEEPHKLFKKLRENSPKEAKKSKNIADKSE